MTQQAREAPAAAEVTADSRRAVEFAEQLFEKLNRPIATIIHHTAKDGAYTHGDYGIMIVQVPMPWIELLARNELHLVEEGSARLDLVNIMMQQPSCTPVVFTDESKAAVAVFVTSVFSLADLHRLYSTLHTSEGAERAEFHWTKTLKVTNCVPVVMIAGEEMLHLSIMGVLTANAMSRGGSA